MDNNGNHRQTIGKQGEDTACKYLESIGHTILERNWRSGHLEIDIISFDSSGIHFVEVKSRQKNIQAPPQENVNTTKQKNITKGALKYLNSSRGTRCRNMECFFDVIAITFVGKTPRIEWIPQAYIPLYM